MILDIEVRRTHDGRKVLVKIYHSEYGTYEHLLFLDEKDRPTISVNDHRNSNIYSILEIDDEIRYADPLTNFEEYYEEDDAIEKKGFITGPRKVDCTLEQAVSMCVCDKEWLEDFQKNWQFCNYDCPISSFKFDKKPIIVKKLIDYDYRGVKTCRKLIAYGRDDIDLPWLNHVKFLYPNHPIGLFVSDYLNGEGLLENLELHGKINRDIEREMEKRKHILQERKRQYDLKLKAEVSRSQKDEFIADLYNINYLTKMRAEMKIELQKEIMTELSKKYRLVSLDQLKRLRAT